MNFNIFNSLILAGVIQGFVFALIWLFTKKYRATSTYYLVSLIFVYSLSNLQYYLLDIGVFKYAEFYDLYHIPLSLLMPPLVLVYGKSLIEENYRISTKEVILFLPFILTLILSLYYKYQLVVNGKPSEYSEFLDGIPTWGEFVAIVYGLIVIAYLLTVINRLQNNSQFSLSVISPQLNWFKTILIFQFFSTLLWTYSEISFASETENYYYYPLWIVLSIIIYWMGHVGIYKYGITQERKKIRNHVNESYSVADISRTENNLVSKFEHYLISEKNYMNPQLSLDLTAEALNVSSGHLSKMINTELQQSFKDYVNNLRVEKAKSFLKDPDFSNYTLVAIGLEAGFNSKSAFNASFKKITDFTPSQYKTQHTN